MSGKVVHFEVPYDEADRARAFYRDAVGLALPDGASEGSALESWPRNLAARRALALRSYDRLAMQPVRIRVRR